MKFICVDRIEKDLVVCEGNKKNFILPLKILPPNIKESDIIYKDKNGQWKIDVDKTIEIKIKNSNLLNILMKNVDFFE
jgi:hypothetical protein